VDLCGGKTIEDESANRTFIGASSAFSQDTAKRDPSVRESGKCKWN